MILFPAIDLKDGQCVRLKRGLMDEATIFNDNPADQATSWQEAGFEWLHLVDLNGAFEGKPVNGAAVDAILGALSIPAQLGGGIRDMATIEMWLEKGVKRVILGTVAVKDPELVKQACRAFPGQIVLGIDAKSGFVATEGWADISDLSVVELAKRFEDAGAASIVYTDVDRDGILAGVNVEATVALAEAVSTPVIASGGVAAIDDIKALLDANCPGIEGVISGRALYDGRIDPAEALTLIKERTC